MTVAPYDHNALWLKAKLFMNRAMDSGEVPFDERALWAALALELLAKAALARVSPSLIAVPTEDGVNLLVSVGLVEGDAHFTSIPAKTLVSRCARAFKPFNDKHATAVINARNEYLHGARPGFTDIPERAWWPRYWSLAAILINAMDQELADFVGHARVQVVEEHLSQNAKNIEHRVEMLVARAKQRLALHESGRLPARLAEEWSRPALLRAGLMHSTDAECPACAAQGVLEGDEVINTEPHYEAIDDHDYDAWLDLTVAADRFSCTNCRLVLDGYELLEQAGLPVEFDDTGDIGDYFDGDDYGND
jgi:hypothetical protein